MGGVRPGGRVSVVQSRAERWSRSHKEHMTPLLSVVGDEMDEFNEAFKEIRTELRAIRIDMHTELQAIRKEMDDGHQANRRLLWGILLAVLAAALTLAASAGSILISAGGS